MDTPIVRRLSRNSASAAARQAKTCIPVHITRHVPTALLALGRGSLSLSRLLSPLSGPVEASEVQQKNPPPKQERPSQPQGEDKRTVDQIAAETATRIAANTGTTQQPIMVVMPGTTVNFLNK